MLKSCFFPAQLLFVLLALLTSVPTTHAEIRPNNNSSPSNIAGGSIRATSNRERYLPKEEVIAATTPAPTIISSCQGLKGKEYKLCMEMEELLTTLTTIAPKPAATTTPTSSAPTISSLPSATPSYWPTYLTYLPTVSEGIVGVTVSLPTDLGMESDGAAPTPTTTSDATTTAAAAAAAEISEIENEITVIENEIADIENSEENAITITDVVGEITPGDTSESIKFDEESILIDDILYIDIGKYDLRLTIIPDDFIDLNALETSYESSSYFTRQYELAAATYHLREVYEAKYNKKVIALKLNFTDEGETVLSSSIVRHSTFDGTLAFDDNSQPEELESVTLFAFAGQDDKENFLQLFHGFYSEGTNQVVEVDDITTMYDVAVTKAPEDDIVALVNPNTGISEWFEKRIHGNWMIIGATTFLAVVMLAICALIMKRRRDRQSKQSKLDIIHKSMTNVGPTSFDKGAPIPMNDKVEVGLITSNAGQLTASFEELVSPQQHRPGDKMQQLSRSFELLIAPQSPSNDSTSSDKSYEKEMESSLSSGDEEDGNGDESKSFSIMDITSKSPYQINMNNIEEDRMLSRVNKQFLSSVKSSSNGSVWSFDDVGCTEDDNTNANTDAPSISNWSMGGASVITSTTSNRFEDSLKKIDALTSILDTTLDTAANSDTSSEKQYVGPVDLDDTDDDRDGGAFIEEILSRDDYVLEDEV